MLMRKRRRDQSRLPSLVPSLFGEDAGGRSPCQRGREPFEGAPTGLPSFFSKLKIRKKLFYGAARVLEKEEEEERKRSR